MTTPEAAEFRQEPTPRRSIMEREFRTLKLGLDDSVLTVVIDHPDNELNLVDVTLMEEFASLVADLRNQQEARVILLSAAGKYFSAGGSFELMNQLHDHATADHLCRLAMQLIHDFLQVPAPIVCAMTGPAIGFGASWVLLSDLVFAGEDVTLSDPHVQRGLASPDGAALWSLAMGPMRAKRFLLTGEKLTARQAMELGLISFVTAAGETVQHARTFAHKLAAAAPSAVAHTKLLCNIHIREALAASLATGTAWELQDSRTNDHQEALDAFRERRDPHFTGA
jgi:enoyl-CoA hydratase